MVFRRVAPSSDLAKLIREFWVFENPETTPEIQKIIPDGFSEIIIHYGDPYRINTNGKWQEQQQMLFSSQISRFFFLENTGASGMLGIKLFPHAFYHLFGMDLSPYTDRVVPLYELQEIDFSALENLTHPQPKPEERIEVIESWFRSILSKQRPYETGKVEEAVHAILSSNGLTDMGIISKKIGVSTRQLERTFKKSVGVTPKFFSRIIRFNHIFQVMEKGNESWIRVALESGYFDQSHFIKNFREFTGEEPSKYGFEERNLANFFLKK